MPDFVAGDTGSELQVTCKDNDTGLAIDLSGATVELLWDDSAGTLVTRTMTAVDAPNGIMKYKFVASELFDPHMHFRVRITDAGGSILTSLKDIEVRVAKAPA